MSDTIRWFLANRYKDDDDDIDQWIRDLQQRLTDEANEVDPSGDWVAEVVAGRDDFQRNATSFRDGDRWAADIGQRTDPWTGQTEYDGVVVPVSVHRGLVLGKPTDAIIKGFLGRPDHEGFVLVYNVGSQDMVIGDMLSRHIVVPPGGLCQVVGTKPTSSDAKRSYALWSSLVVRGMETTTSVVKGQETSKPASGRRPKATSRSSGDTDDWQSFVSECRQQASVARSLADYVPKAADWASSTAEFLDGMADTADNGRFCTQKMIDALDKSTESLSRWTDRLPDNWMDSVIIDGDDIPF